MNKRLIIKVSTACLTLRNMAIDDISQAYVDWLNDPEINRYLTCSNSRQTIQTCLSYVHSFEGQNDKALIGIFFKENGLHIGNITISGINWHDRMGTVGISLGRKEYMNRGLAQEALTGVVNHCFNELKLHRIQAGVSENNFNSLNLFLSCGFKIEGLLRESSFFNGRFQDGYILGIVNKE